MTTSNITFNAYKFWALDLTSYDSSTTYDLREWFKEVRIYESMFTSSMHVDIIIQDPENMLVTLPIVGQETVNIWLQAELNSAEILKLSMKVYSVTDIKTVNETIEYVLQLVTTDFTMNFEEKISRHVSGYGSSIASDIFNESDIDSNKFISVEQSMDEHDLVIPNMSPFRCINWLSSRCHNDTSTSYVFFENNREYMFKSIESFFDESIKYKYRGSGKNVNSYGTMKNQEEENRSLISYKVISRFNVIDNITKGMYASGVMSCDVVHRKVKKTTHSWYEDSEKYQVRKREIKSRLYPLMSKNPNSMLKYYPDNVMLVPHNQLNKYNISDNILKYNYGNQLFDNLKMNIEVSGNTSLAVGDLLEIEIPVKRPGNEVVRDEIYAGKWLIINITHIITRDSYIMSIDVAKDRIGLNL